MEKITHSAEETQSLAQMVLDNLRDKNVIALYGDLGAGKTTFVQGLAAALKIQSTVNSPTFLLLKNYAIPGHPRFKNLAHLDLYRIHNWDELAELDLPTIWSDPENLVVIEWPERIADHLPDTILSMEFEHVGDVLHRHIHLKS